MTMRFSSQMICSITTVSLGLASILVALPSNAEVVNLDAEATVRSSDQGLIAQARKATLAEIASSNLSFSILTKMLKHLEVVDVLKITLTVSNILFCTD